MKLRLIVDVEYDLNGTDPDALKILLGSIPRYAANVGRLTDDTPAEVVTWDARVEEVQPSGTPKYKYEIIEDKDGSARQAFNRAFNEDGDGNEDAKPVEDLAVGESTLRVTYNCVYRVTREE